jgi:hypothetical protein
MIYCGQPPAKKVMVEKEGKIKQKHHVQNEEINYLEGISNEKVIKDSSQVPRNKTLKDFSSEY